MTAAELAATLNGREYTKEITKAEHQAAQAAGLVVVFGGSDDLIELRGAIYDEFGAPGEIRVCADGILKPWPERFSETWEEEEAEAYFKRKAAGFKVIESLWNPGGNDTVSWAYKTDIPHATFNVMEDGEVFCRGIVFALADITA